MTAIAAAEKKKKRDEMYYKFNTSRGMGYWKSRMRDYDQAANLYTTAIENAEPGHERPLIIARSKAYSKLVDHDTARKDALDVINKYPEDIQGLENDAYTLYEKDDFEDALVRNYCGLRKRKKPDYFYKGILVGKETIEDCIGRNAGPCLDHERLGHIVVDMHMKPSRWPKERDELAVAKKKSEKERIERFLAQKYLGRLAADKQFLKEFLELPDLQSGNKEHNEQLQALISHMIEVIERQQETLMTQRPMYMLKHHEPKFSPAYKEQRKKEEDTWRNGVMKVIKKLLDDANTLKEERKIEACLNTCERLRRFVECQPPVLLSSQSREQTLDKLYITIGQLFMGMKTFIPSWSEEDNERRIEYMLHSRVDDPRFLDRVRQTFHPKIWNVKEMKRSLESRLSISIHKVERTFLYHELSRCLFEEGATEKAYKAASSAYKISKDLKDSLWSFNNGFLSGIAVLLEGNTDDAKIVFTEVMINARKLERDDCASFIQKVIKIATDPLRLDFDPPDPIEQRKKEIINIMPTPELKIKAQVIMQKVTSAPFKAKMQLQPTTTSKTATIGGSRRSMKITTRAKRRTLYEVKSSRHQTQHFVPSKIDLPNID